MTSAWQAGASAGLYSVGLVADVKQVMPATGAELHSKSTASIQVEPNIHAGVKYVRRLISDSRGDEPMDPISAV
jgi:hypothetical protein